MKTTAISANELMLGNWVMYKGEMCRVETVSLDMEDESEPFINVHRGGNVYECIVLRQQSNELQPIPLSAEILVKCGFVKIPHLIYNSAFDYNLGRGRYLSINDCGTPNEVWFLTEREDKNVLSIVTIKNYDYDGRTYLHQLQNILSSLGQPLTIEL